MAMFCRRYLEVSVVLCILYINACYEQVTIIAVYVCNEPFLSRLWRFGGWGERENLSGTWVAILGFLYYCTYYNIWPNSYQTNILQTSTVVCTQLHHLLCTCSSVVPTSSVIQHASMKPRIHLVFFCMQDCEQFESLNIILYMYVIIEQCTSCY